MTCAIIHQPQAAAQLGRGRPPGRWRPAPGPEGVTDHQLGPPRRSRVVGANEAVGHGHAVDGQGRPQQQASVAGRAADSLLRQAGQVEAHRFARRSVDPGGGAMRALRSPVG